MESKLVNVHTGSSSESWLVVYEENDGYRFLRRGPETVDAWIDLSQVKQLAERHKKPQLIDQVQAALAEFGQKP
jgi:hypothetical protein